MLKQILTFSLLFFYATTLYSYAQEERDKHDSASISAIDKVKRSVVSVYVIIEDHKGGKKQYKKTGGSGFIIDPEGHVVTNFHVAGDATKFKVKLWNKQEIGATLVGADPWTDIAVLQLNLNELEGTSLTWSSLGDSDKVVQGESVFAIGMPAGLERTVTKGIVSTEANDRARTPWLLGRGLEGKFFNHIQTNAELYGGNSGGPLCNMKGEVVGVVNSGIANAGFAIPINIVKDVSSKILKTGEVGRSYVGIELQELDLVDSISDTKQGVLISNVDRYSPAEKAGIKPGDILVMVGEEKINARYFEEAPRINNLLANLEINKDYIFSVIRGSETKDIEVTTTKLEPYVGSALELPEWGCVVKDMTFHMASKRNLPKSDGVIIASMTPTGPAKKSGLEFADIIVSINGTPIGAIKDLQEFYKDWESAKNQAVIKIIRGKEVRYVIINPEN